MGVEAGGAAEEVAGPAEEGAGGFVVLEDVAPGFAGGESGVCPGGAGLAGEGFGVEGVAEDGEVEGLEVGGFGGWAVGFFVEGFEAAVGLADEDAPVDEFLDFGFEGGVGVRVGGLGGEGVDLGLEGGVEVGEAGDGVEGGVEGLAGGEFAGAGEGGGEVFFEGGGEELALFFGVGFGFGVGVAFEAGEAFFEDGEAAGGDAEPGEFGGFEGAFDEGSGEGVGGLEGGLDDVEPAGVGIGGGEAEVGVGGEVGDFGEAVFGVVEAAFVGEEVEAEDGGGGGGDAVVGEDADVDAMGADGGGGGAGFFRGLPGDGDLEGAVGGVGFDDDAGGVALEDDGAEGEGSAEEVAAALGGEGALVGGLVATVEAGDGDWGGGELPGVGFFGFEVVGAGFEGGFFDEVDEDDGGDGAFGHAIGGEDHFQFVELSGVEDDGVRFGGEVVGVGLDGFEGVTEEVLEGGDEEAAVDEGALNFGGEGGGGAEEGFEEGLVGAGGALGDEDGGGVLREEIAPAADAIAAGVVVLVFGVDVELVGEVLFGEEGSTGGVHEVEAGEAAAAVGGGGHGTVAEGGGGVDEVGGAFVASGFAVFVFEGVGFESGPHGQGEVGVGVVAIFVGDGGEACGGAFGGPVVEEGADFVGAGGDGVGGVKWA